MEFKLKKKGQEEIVGFVLIVVIVAVVFLVFLGISIKQTSSEAGNENLEVYQFLESAMVHTSECAVRFESDFATLGELFKECYLRTKCLNGVNACDMLNVTLTNIFENSWQIAEGSPIKGYRFKSFYSTSTEKMGEEIISLEKGGCASGVKGASYISSAFPGRIRSIMELCL